MSLSTQLQKMFRIVTMGLAEDTITITRNNNSIDSPKTGRIGTWNTKCLFDPKGKVIRDGRWDTRMVLLVPNIKDFEPREGDRVTCNERVWTIVGVQPIGVTSAVIGYQIDVGL